jgi:glutamate synthase (ferredoxin)
MYNIYWKCWAVIYYYLGVSAPVGKMKLQSLTEAHVEKTSSNKGAAIMEYWDKYLSLFWQLVPPNEEDTPEANAKYETTASD